MGGPKPRTDSLAGVNLLEVDTGERGGAVYVALRGELDLSTVDEAERALLEAERASPPLMLIDLSSLTFLDSTGLRAIVTADLRAREGDRRVVVVKGPETVHRVFTITRLEERLNMVDDAESGVAPDAEA
jgi:anti-sigma B factor antagonist